MAAQCEFHSPPEIYPVGVDISVVSVACMKSAVVAAVDCSKVAGPVDNIRSYPVDYIEVASVAVGIAFLPCYFDFYSAWSLDNAVVWVVHMVAQGKVHSVDAAAVNKDCCSSHIAGFSSYPSVPLDCPVFCPEAAPSCRGSWPGGCGLVLPLFRRRRHLHPLHPRLGCSLLRNDCPCRFL